MSRHDFCALLDVAACSTSRADAFYTRSGWITLLPNQLPISSLASLYDIFPPTDARRIPGTRTASRRTIAVGSPWRSWIWPSYSASASGGPPGVCRPRPTLKVPGLTGAMPPKLGPDVAATIRRLDLT